METYIAIGIAILLVGLILNYGFIRPELNKKNEENLREVKEPKEKIGSEPKEKIGSKKHRRTASDDSYIPFQFYTTVITLNLVLDYFENLSAFKIKRQKENKSLFVWWLSIIIIVMFIFWVLGWLVALIFQIITKGSEFRPYDLWKK